MTDTPGPDESAVPGLPDLGSLFEQAQEMLSAQAGVGDEVVVGQAGGGAVTIEVTGDWEFRSVAIRPDAVDPDDVEVLADLVLAALRDATRRVTELHRQALADVDPGGLLGGGGLDDLLGGGAGGGEDPGP